ncbi:phage tail tape measure protein [Mycobacterium avium]|uniref:phage tail tape measure protein n=2 Tax=Mycobacterium avium TaxID=1764 RepID=UPI002351143E|nr:phage tail tape measure protein [Mycobacterium avium]
MSVYLDVGIRADERAAVAASRRLIDLFAHTGSQINRDLSSQLGKALAAIDGSAARRELLALQQEFRRTADVEADAAARMIRDQRRLAEATAKYGEDSSRAATANAMLARSQREHVDAMVAAEAAHVRLTKASGDTANSVSRMQQLGANPIFNAAGIGSVAAMGIGLTEFARKAGDFQQSIIKLGAAADVPVGQLKAVSDGLLKLTGQVPYSAQELADAFYDVAKAGYKGADGLKVIEVGAQLASVEGADLKEVINGLTTTVNDFHIPAEKLAETASKINVAVGDAKTNLQAFSGSLHNIEPVASIANNQMEQVYAAMARFSQSGFSMDQGTQNLAQVYRNFMGPNQQMRDAVGKLGLSMNDLQAKIADPNVGVIGVLQILSDTIRSKTAPDGQVAIDTFYKNADASNALREAYGALTGRSKEMADAINSGVVPNMRQLHQQMELDPKLAQWDTARHKVDGLSSNLRKLQGDLEPVQQLWKEVTGTAEGFNMAATLVGSPEALQATIDEWKKLQGVVAGANDPVKGFTDTNKGLNAQLKEAKDKFGAAAIEIGTAFVPAITEAAHGAKWIGDELAKHPGIAEAAAVAVGGVGAAWLAIKGYNVVSTVLSPIASGLGTLTTRLGETRAAALLFNESLAAAGPAAQAGAAGVEVAAAGEIAAENRVRDAALEADAALDAGGGGLPGGNGGGRVARSIKAGARALPFVGTAMAVQDVATSVNPNNDPTNRSDQGWGHLLLGQSWDWITGHAEGGPLHAPGPKGRDSALFWGADGEHVLTHHEVQRMGGHSAVYQFRSDLMNGRIVLGRQFGGPLGRDDGGAVSRLYQEAEALNGGPYVWGSTDCSGAVSMLVNAALGTSGRMSTATAAQWLSERGFQPGYGPPGSLQIGWYNGGPGGGHMAATLPDGTHFESGGQHGGIMLGGQAAGAESSQFTHHMYLPLQGFYPDGPAAAGGAGMPGMGFGMGAGMGGFGGGIPPGARAGTGPGGQPGYYTANPQRVAAAEERLRHLDAEIDNAEKRKAELKATAKQSERDRLDEEIRHLKQERAQAQQRLTEAEQGTFHAMHGRRGAGGGSPFLPVPLADQFGLSKGLPGLAEWTVGFLEDLVLGPMETAAWAALGGRPPGAGLGGGFGPAGLGFPNPAPFGAPGASGAVGARVDTAAGLGGPARGNEIAAARGGSAAAPSTPGSWNEPYWTKKPTSPTGAPASPSGPRSAGPGIHTQNDYRLFQAGVLDADGNVISGPVGPGLSALLNPSRFSSGAGTSPMLAPGDPGLLGGGSDRGPQGLQGQPPAIVQGPASHAPSNTLLPPLYRATGGPSGTDTIPAWLSPGEQVEQKSAVDKYGSRFMTALNQGLVDPAIVQYFDEGSNGPVEPPGQQQQQPPAQQPPQMLKAPGGPGGPQQPKPPGGPQPGQPAGPKPGDVAQTPGSQQGLSDTATPGADIRQLGSDLPAQPGIGFSGGIIGGLEGAASQAAAMGADMGTFGGAGGAVSSAMNIGFQELNRAAAYGAQAAGIGVEGILEALIPNSDATGADWSKTIPGRLLMGVTGVRPAGQQNTAGQTQQPFASNASGDQYAQPGGNTTPGAPIQILGPVHIQANDANQMHESLNQQTNMAAATVGVQRSASQAYW